MSEGLMTTDGKPVPLEVVSAEREFNAAMAAPEGDVPAPRKMTAEAKEAIRTQPKRSPRARPDKTEKARVVPSASQKVDKDFTEDVQGITQGLWLTAASIPPTQAYAAIIKLNQPALVASLNQGAQNNAAVRGYVEKMSSGSGGMWMVSLGVTVANMGMQTLQLMKDPQLRRDMAAQTRQELDAFLKANGFGQMEQADNGTDKDS